MVDEIVLAICALHTDGITAPSKGEIVNNMVGSYLRPGAPATARSALLTSHANDVEVYFKEAVKEAAPMIDLPYHFVTKQYYADTEKGSTVSLSSKAVATSWVSVFANGRASKTEGVRFVSEESQNDVLLMISIEKQASVVKGSNAALVAKVVDGAKYGALPLPDVARLTAGLSTGEESTEESSPAVEGITHKK